jgi:hypothetical protein
LGEIRKWVRYLIININQEIKIYKKIRGGRVAVKIRERVLSRVYCLIKGWNHG